MVTTEQRMSIHRALADERRSQIAAELEASPEGLDVRQLAERLELHANTIRWHLGILADAGLVSSRTAERSAPGRPRILYSLMPGAEVAGRDEYRLLATILTATLASRDDGSGQAASAGRIWGRYLVATPPPGTRVSDEQAAERVAELLDEQGFAPRVEDGTLCMYRCPFAELATTHPEIVCTLHRGLIDGALEELGTSLETIELEVFPRPDRCVAHLGRRSNP
jgi:predicted ArsR family transcriptional regulator